MMKTKSAQSHVEIILATVLFIGFLIFLFIFINPSFRKNQDIQIKNIEKTVLESISSDMGKLPVIINTTNDCYSLNEVNDEYGNNFIEIKDPNNPTRYTIYYSDFFDPNIIGLISCSNFQDKNFTLGVYKEESIIVKQKIIDFKTSYQDYNTLKESLRIGDFSFNFKNFERSIIPELSVEPTIPENVDVASKDFPVRVIDNQGEVQELILNIKAWK